MHILYRGNFLKEGLEALGHTITTISSEQNNLVDIVGKSTSSIDCILIELFGNTLLPEGLAQCSVPLIAYCVDTPINFFWLKHYLKLFDVIFVDQKASVHDLQSLGIHATWLPLCASAHDFRPITNLSEHHISFVGRITEHRRKRTNLLRVIHNAFPLHHTQGVSRKKMQDIHASSHIVLNENFFSGVNLRTFQAMASGSILLTEHNCHGLEMLFTEGEHYLSYGPSNILHQIERLLNNTAEWKDKAKSSQEICRSFHTSRNRAETVIDKITGKILTANRESESDRIFHEALGVCLYRERFGGNFRPQVEALQALSDESVSDPIFRRYTLGKIYAENGKLESAKRELEIAAADSSESGLRATILLAQIGICTNDKSLTIRALERAIAYSWRQDTTAAPTWKSIKLDNSPVARCAVFLLCSHLLQRHNFTMDVGFCRQSPSSFPDTALELSIMAWKTVPSTQALTDIINITDSHGIGPESLEFVTLAILNGLATNKQIAKAVEFAIEYYDKDMAQTLVQSLRRGKFAR